MNSYAQNQLLLPFKQVPLLTYDRSKQVPLLTYDSSVYVTPTMYYGYPSFTDFQFYENSIRNGLQSLDYIFQSEVLKKNWPEGSIHNLEKRYAKRHEQVILEAYPKIQTLLLAKSWLQKIVDKYQQTHHLQEDELLKQLSEVLKSYTPDRQGNVSVPLKFHTSVDPEFKVDGNDVNRLAINIGNQIIFNIDALIRVKDFNFLSAVQILLHEIMHDISKVPVEIKDALGAKIVEFVRSRTTELRLDAYRTYTILALPFYNGSNNKELENFIYKHHVYNETRGEAWVRFVKEHILAFESTFRKISLLDDLYRGFATLDDMVPGKSESWDHFKNDYEKESYRWAIISDLAARLSPSGNLVLEYHQRSQFYQKSAHNQQMTGQLEGLESDQYPYKATIPETRYRINFDFLTKSVETQRKLDIESDEKFQFFIDKKITAKEGVYFSIKANIPGVTKKEAENIFLVARQQGSNKLFSFQPLKIKALEKDQYQLHFKAPPGVIQLAYLLMGQIGNDGFYKEIRIRPNTDISIVNRNSTNEYSADLNRISFRPKIKKTDKVFAEFEFNKQVEISGITVEVLSVARARKIQVSGFVGQIWGGRYQTNTKEMAEFGVSSKHYYPYNKKASTKKLNLDLAEIEVSQFVMGPVITQKKFSHFMPELRHRDRLRTVIDTKNRRIINVWAHFKNGEIKKMKLDKLGNAEFSLISHEEAKERGEHFEKYWKTYWNSFDLSLPSQNEGKTESRSCRQLQL